MKLFQKILIAGASVSLLAPIAAQASDVFNSNSSTLDNKTFSDEVEDIANLKSLVKELQSKIEELDSLQSNQSQFEAGSFSTTTSMDGKATMWIGAIEGISDIDDDEDGSLADEPSDGVQTGYTYTMNLNTSFSGDDNLYVRLKAGNNGDAWSSKNLANTLSNWMFDSEYICILIGGPDGLSPKCLERADHIWSLAPITLPHFLVRIILVEQLYRACSINLGHPYHRE